MWTFLLLITLAISYELVYTLWGWAIFNDYKKLAIFTTALMPLVTLAGFNFLIEAQTSWDRALVYIADSIGYALGAAIVLYLLPSKVDSHGHCPHCVRANAQPEQGTDSVLHPDCGGGPLQAAARLNLERLPER